MREIITVYTGEIKTISRLADLKSSPIGSCVLVVLFDENSKAGGMAHIMLPGKAPEKENVLSCRYAKNAVEMLIQELSVYGVNKEDLKAVVVGGGNVLEREGDTIGKNNIDSVSNILGLKNIPILARSVGGTNRKSVRFDIEQRVIYFAEGDFKEKILLNFSKKINKCINCEMGSKNKKETEMEKLHKQVSELKQQEKKHKLVEEKIKAANQQLKKGISEICAEYLSFLLLFYKHNTF